MNIAERIRNGEELRGDFIEKTYRALQEGNPSSAIAIVSRILVEEGSNDLRIISWGILPGASSEKLSLWQIASMWPEKKNKFQLGLGEVMVGTIVESMESAYRTGELDTVSWLERVNQAFENTVIPKIWLPTVKREITLEEYQSLKESAEKDNTFAGLFERGAPAEAMIINDLRVNNHADYFTSIVRFLVFYKEIAQVLLEEFSLPRREQLETLNTLGIIREAERIAGERWGEIIKGDRQAAEGCGCPKCRKRWLETARLTKINPSYW